MSWLSNATVVALRCAPRTLKDVVRKLTPQWAYQTVARVAEGGPLIAKESGQLYLYDRQVRVLEIRLWHGYAGAALQDLEALVGRRQQAEAAMALARYYAGKGTHEKVLEYLYRIKAASHPLWMQKRARIMEIYALLGVAQHDQACQVAKQVLENHLDDINAYLAIASAVMARDRHGETNVTNASMAYLHYLNHVLQHGEFLPLACKDHTRQLTLDNLVPARKPSALATMPAKVSVIMAVYNGQNYLKFALRSLLEQTWRNLEIVIVDDASTDGSWELMQDLASEDDRIVLVHQPVNGGAYIARNAGLQQATGDFVTANDADDWAHPQKIETQVRALLEPGANLANVTSLIRVNGDMIAQPRFDSPHVPIVHKNYSSLMLPRTEAMRMGGWDRVRISADSEFIGRLQAVHGDAAVAHLHADVPLSFALVEKNNLTASSSRGLWTFRFGARHEYARQYKEWHRSDAVGVTQRTSQLVPFPVPGLCYETRAGQQEFDIVIVSDFQNADALRTYAGGGGRIAILPWPSYREEYDLAMGDGATQCCRQYGIVTLVHGERVHCQQLVILCPNLLMFRLDRIPEIVADEVTLIGQQATGPNSAVVAENVRWAFGKAGTWAPAMAD